jgi:tripartite-type tricarboxylate transporter receptor subunit TctC
MRSITRRRNGSAPHLAAEIFKRMANVRLLHVPYKGSTPGINDVISGQVQLTFTGIPSVLLRSKRKAAAARRDERQARAALPNVPTIGESGVPGYEVSPWFGVLVPARTPPALVTRLNSEIVKVLRSAAIRERLRRRRRAGRQHARAVCRLYQARARQVGKSPQGRGHTRRLKLSIRRSRRTL